VENKGFEDLEVTLYVNQDPKPPAIECWTVGTPSSQLTSTQPAAVLANSSAWCAVPVSAYPTEESFNITAKGANDDLLDDVVLDVAEARNNPGQWQLGNNYQSGKGTRGYARTPAKMYLQYEVQKLQAIRSMLAA
jgi:hypothetical protein